MEKKRQAGWYVDPTMKNTQRFFDGEDWTDQTMPLMPADQDTRSARTAKALYGILLGLVLMLALLYLLDGGF